MLTYYFLNLNTLFYAINHSVIFSNFTITRTFNILMYCSCLFFILFMRNIKKKDFFYFILSVFLLIMTKRLYISLMIILPLVIKIEKIEYYYKINMIILSVGLIIIMLLAKFDFIENLIWTYRIYGHTGIQVRQGLGFLNPNFPALVFWMIRISFYYLKYEKLKCYHFLLFLILTLNIYYQIYSRTIVFLFILEVAIYYFLKYFYEYIKEIIKVIPIIHVTFTFIIIYFFKDSILDDFLSYRLKYSYEFFKNLNKYTFFFGDRNKFELALDNSYISLLHDYGIIVFIFIIYLLYKGVKNIVLFEKKERVKKIIFVFLVYLFYSMSEAVLFSPYYSFITIILIKYTLIDFNTGEKNVKSKNIKKSTVNNVR